MEGGENIADNTESCRDRREKRTLLNPKNDLVFKAMLSLETSGWSKPLLIRLINLILGQADKRIAPGKGEAEGSDEKDVKMAGDIPWAVSPIQDLVYRNPISVNENINEKTIILDVKVITDRGEVVDLEMQLADFRDYECRVLYYIGKMTAESLVAGEDYDKIKKVINISFLDHILYPDEEEYHAIYRMSRLEDSMQPFHEKSPEIHFIELKKFERMKKPVSEMTELERFLLFMTEAGKSDGDKVIEEIVRYDKGGAAEMAYEALQKVSEEERMRELALAREMFLRDQIAIRNTAIREGLEEGREKGLKEGRKEGIELGKNEGLRIGRSEGEYLKLIQLIRKKMKKGMSCEEIAELLEEEFSAIYSFFQILEKDMDLADERVLAEAQKNTV